ncbi:MAG: hypothetical protein HC817_08285 [Saprospiraceae bacterium]|nr:hypothetical protein [Saprospiraceae bacterium]
MKKTFFEIQTFLNHYSPKPAVGYVAQRLNSLSGLISGAIHTGSSHLAKIGSGLPQEINALSKEIHAKRFLENKHIGIRVHYMPYLKQFLAGILLKSGKLRQKHNFKVIIDGSQTGSRHVTLMLSIVVGNRSIPVFWVVRKGKKGHFPTEMHTDLVEKGITTLQEIVKSLAIDATFCLLGDGEFDSVDLQTLCRTTLKIDYVLRTSSDAVLYMMRATKLAQNRYTIPSNCQMKLRVFLSQILSFQTKNLKKSIFYTGLTPINLKNHCF